MKRKLFFIGFIILLLFMMQDTFLLTASSFLPKKDVNEKQQLVVLNKEKHIVKQDELVLYEKMAYLKKDDTRLYINQNSIKILNIIKLF